MIWFLVSVSVGLLLCAGLLLVIRRADKESEQSESFLSDFGSILWDATGNFFNVVFDIWKRMPR